mgnify:CR=1 FL=1
MATLALGAAGAAIGASVLPSVSFLGATLTGAAVGQAIGASLGSVVDQSLFGASGQSRHVEGPRLASLQIMASTEGAPVPRVYGRARIGGQVIWATRLEEEATTTSSGGGGKGIGGGGNGGSRVDYSYFANFAVGLCEGPITRIGRVWADGKDLDLTGITYRLHHGHDDQPADSLIEAKEGAGTAPGYRGLAYVVFERLALARFGNRLPQLSFEVFRSIDGFEERIQSVTVIPGSGEFAYAPTEVIRDAGSGVSLSENRHSFSGDSDWAVAMDQLQADLPNAQNVSLVVSWFGTDLRAGSCQLQPRVETHDKVTTPVAWSVAGLTRAAANVVSTVAGRPAFGGTPSDASVMAAISDLRGRGIAVTFYPFILMDVPAGNSLPDPYGGGAQATYPWRGRITVHPAAGQAGSPDKTAAAASQVAAIVGTAQVSDFAIAGGAVSYSGPAEWSLRRMVLHYAHLCQAAGGVDAFIIGSELRGLTTVRSAASTYPFVTALATLAADVKAVLGAGTKITYAADWSEYFGHQPGDGSGDVYFHLDDLWSVAAIDAIGIDVYWPLSDWRDGEAHLDRQAGVPGSHDLAYLKGNIFAGEGYDWFYASPAHRKQQTRTPITDGAGKPWVFRYKDIRAWWSNAHYNRPGGTESTTATSWVPASKPIWFTELGCPAVDKGANQPNVFYDPKSSESALPFFSNGRRDDLIQRRVLQALVETFDPAQAGFDPAANPLSPVYGGRMVDPARLTVYTWDARPFPAFPQALDVWADGTNWERGHWLIGRAAGGAVAGVVAAILSDYGFTSFDAAAIPGTLDGYVVERTMSARQALQPLELAFFFDSFEDAGTIRFRPRGAAGPFLEVSPDDLVETSPETSLFRLTRRQETELPAAARFAYIDGTSSYRQAAVESRRIAMRSSRLAVADLPMVLPPETAQAIAESALQDAWAARRQAAFTLPPSRLAVGPADSLRLIEGGRAHELRVTGISEGIASGIEALSIEPAVFSATTAAARQGQVPLPEATGATLAAFLDLPVLDDSESATQGFLAVQQAPWPGSVALHRSPDGIAYELSALATRRATIGETTSLLPAGPTSRWDHATTLDVRLANGTLAAASEIATLNGANLAAIETVPGTWELIQFRDVALIGSNLYRLSTLLRGQRGTEGAIAASLPVGARFVLLDAAIAPVALTREQIGLPFQWRYGPGSRPIGHASYTTRTHAFKGIGLRPLSPVHIRGARASGDLTISWVRRTRVGGDSWEAVEVPLGEESEGYVTEILDGATVKRTLTSAAPSVIYTAAQQTADWGAPQTVTVARVAQLSAIFGRGVSRTATV